MRPLVVLALASVAGCAGVGLEPYSAPPDQPTARLRVVTQRPENSLVLLTHGMSCPASAWGNLTIEGDRTLAHFRRASGRKQPRLNMPDSSRWQGDTFAESRVEAEKAIYLRAHYFLNRHCFSVGRIRLRAGKDYELLFSHTMSDEGWGCELAVAELVLDGKGGVSRLPQDFLEGPRNCEIGR